MKYRVHIRTYLDVRPIETQTHGMYAFGEALHYLTVCRYQDAQDGIGADYWMVPV